MEPYNSIAVDLIDEEFSKKRNFEVDCDLKNHMFTQKKMEIIIFIFVEEIRRAECFEKKFVRMTTDQPISEPDRMSPMDSSNHKDIAH